MTLSSQDLDARFQDICRRHDWKRTAQRRVVFSCLYGNCEHPTAESVWNLARAALPDISLDSVYRILKEFVGAGLVQRLDNGQAVRYDPDVTPHDHFVCERCGRVLDFYGLDRDAVLRACAEVGKATSMELSVKGMCRECRRGE